MIEKPTFKLEVEPKILALRFYDDTHDDNFFAVCSMFIHGKRGTIHNLLGDGFYKYMKTNGGEIFTQCKIDTIEAVMTPAHARLLRMALKSQYDISVGPVITAHDRSMVTIEIKQKI